MKHHNPCAQFATDGFAVLRQYQTPAQVDALRSEVQRFIDTRLPALPREEVFYENKQDAGTLKQIQRMHLHDPFFESLTVDSPLHHLAAELLGQDVRPVNLQYFNKPPQIGKATPAHQDGYYFMLEPNEAVTLWLALDDVDEENGCIRYIPGSHRRGLRPHGRTQTLGFSQGLLDFGADDEQREVVLPARPGDLLAHHSLTIHRADANGSATRTRRALGFVYFAVASTVNKDQQRRHAQLMQDLRTAGKI